MSCAQMGGVNTLMQLSVGEAFQHVPVDLFLTVCMSFLQVSFRGRRSLFHVAPPCHVLKWAALVLS